MQYLFCYIMNHNTELPATWYEVNITRKCAEDYYTTAYRRSERDIGYGGAIWLVMFIYIGYRHIE